jgi:SAM-dependent methyltransferase
MLPNYFDTDVAARYDEGDPRFDPDHLDQEAGFLADLAGAGGRALELAIGTGRVALPLAARGIEVAGIDLSAAMVEQLRAKPGGADLLVEIGDFTSTRVDGEFDLVYLVYNTIGNVTTQDAQVATFENAARHLRSGGCFVVETGVPAVRDVPAGERYRVFHHGEDHHGIDEYDAATQAMWSHHYTRLADGTYRRDSIPFRYAWPAELDLMARIAGLRLRERWAWWDRTPFTTSSTAHVSVWEKGSDVTAT